MNQDYQQLDPSQLRLTRAEYWLLETAVVYQIPLPYLKPKGIETRLNKRGHGLDRQRLEECLGQLFRSGLIEATIAGSEEAIPEFKGALITAALDAGRFDLKLSYRLTALGGATWEAFASPQWDRFLWEDYDDDTGVGRVIAMDRRHLERYLQYLALDLMDERIDSATIEIKEIENWRATYWKELPSGFCASFTYRRVWSGIHLDHMSSLAFGGFCEFRDGWYRWQ